MRLVHFIVLTLLAGFCMFFSKYRTEMLCDKKINNLSVYYSERESILRDSINILQIQELIIDTVYLSVVDSEIEELKELESSTTKSSVAHINDYYEEDVIDFKGDTATVDSSSIRQWHATTIKEEYAQEKLKISLENIDKVSMQRDLLSEKLQLSEDVVDGLLEINEERRIENEKLKKKVRKGKRITIAVGIASFILGAVAVS